MRINIEYESSWRNSFLEGNNNEPIPAKGRKFIGSMTNLKKAENYKPKQISNDTVMGVLNRLIGDQKKLYQARNSEKYFFKELEQTVSFKDTPIITNEMTFIRNITGSTDQNSFTGAITLGAPIFTSDYSSQFWGVLDLKLDELTAFILDDNYQVDNNVELSPIHIINKLELLNKEKAVANEDKISQSLNVLNKHFEGVNYLNNKGRVVPISLYCSALYLQLERLNNRYDMSSAKTKAGGISGISKRGFTKKDFMNTYTTGEKKRIWGNPYIHEEFIKGEGKVRHLMTKASGKLEITLDIDRTKAKEIKKMINDAGVSSFYLGKKGLAYVTDISTREVRT